MPARLFSSAAAAFVLKADRGSLPFGLRSSLGDPPTSREKKEPRFTCLLSSGSSQKQRRRSIPARLFLSHLQSPSPPNFPFHPPPIFASLIRSLLSHLTTLLRLLRFLFLIFQFLLLLFPSQSIPFWFDYSIRRPRLPSIPHGCLSC